MSLSGHVALVTGASSGIGRATALMLAGEGARVFAAARSTDKLNALADEAAANGWHIEPLTLDVTSAASIAAAAEHISAATDGYGLDILVNNAGYGLMGPLEEIDLDAVRQQFETNVFGLLAVTQQFLPAMRRRRRGRIINVSSIGGRLALTYGGAYTASKFAVEALSDTLRLEVAPWNIHVSVIEPGPIATEFGEQVRQHLDLKPNTAYPLAADYLKMFDQTAAGAPPKAVAKVVLKAVSRSRQLIRATAPEYWAIPLKIIEILPDRLTFWLQSRSTGAMAKRFAEMERPDSSSASSASTEVATQS